MIAIPSICFGVLAFAIASFAGNSDPDRRGATGFQLVMVCVGAFALVAGLVAFAASSSRSPCRIYASGAVVGDC